MKKTQEHFEAYDYFKKNLKLNDTIYCIIKHVSKSGMTRHIAFFYIGHNRPYWITHDIHQLLGYKMNKYHDAIVVGGCGMDMAWSVVNNLEGQINQDYEETYSTDPMYKKEDLKPFKLKSRIL